MCVSKLLSYIHHIEVSHHVNNSGSIVSVIHDCVVSGERRIRVHTLCVAVSSQPAHVYAGLNVQAITGVLAMMGKLTRI